MDLPPNLQKILNDIVAKLNTELPIDLQITIDKFPFPTGPTTGLQLTVPRKYKPTWEKGPTGWTNDILEEIASKLVDGQIMYKVDQTLFGGEEKRIKAPERKTTIPTSASQQSKLDSKLKASTSSKPDRKNPIRSSRTAASVPPTSTKDGKKPPSRETSVAESRNNRKDNKNKNDIPGAVDASASATNNKTFDANSPLKQKSPPRLKSPILEINHKPATSTPPLSVGQPSVVQGTTIDLTGTNKSLEAAPGQLRQRKRLPEDELVPETPKKARFEVVIPKQESPNPRGNGSGVGNGAAPLIMFDTDQIINIDDDDKAQLAEVKRAIAAKQRMKRELADKDAEIERLQSALQEQSDKIGQLKMDVKSRDTVISDQIGQIKDLEECINHKNKKIRQYERFVTSYRSLSEQIPSDREHENSGREEEAVGITNGGVDGKEEDGEVGLSGDQKGPGGDSNGSGGNKLVVAKQNETDQSNREKEEAAAEEVEAEVEVQTPIADKGDGNEGVDDLTAEEEQSPTQVANDKGNSSPAGAGRDRNGS